ncbi:MAG: DUF4252 domain-containing protein [Pyrinomonadaceae bacterium]|nr:DUF4252 domain-containing protein [Pyrinomonadaceae bacterium]
MRTLFKTMKLASLALLLGLSVTTTTRAQNARIDMGPLDHLGAQASEAVDVNIDERLMQITAKFLSGKEPDEVKIKELINGLKGIYVKSFEFENDGGYSQADVDSIRSQLRNPVWSKILNISSKREGSIEVYVMSNAAQVGGLVVLATDPKELTVVNIVGPVDLEKLSQLEGQFGVPDLGIEITKPKPKN